MPEIGPLEASRLASAGIETTRDLLARCSTSAGRKQVAADTGLWENQIFHWVNLADLMRISGIGPQYSALLENAGVASVQELRRCQADNLAVEMETVNLTKNLSRNSPAPKTVQTWIQEASEMFLIIKS